MSCTICNEVGNTAGPEYMYACMALKPKSFCLFDFMKAVLPAMMTFISKRINATAAEELWAPTRHPFCITSVCQHKGLLDVAILPVPAIHAHWQVRP